MNYEDISKLDNQKFYNWVVEAAFEKTLLEVQFAGKVLDDNEQARLRAAICVGVTETLIKLKDLVRIGLEEEGS